MWAISTATRPPPPTRRHEAQPRRADSWDAANGVPAASLEHEPSATDDVAALERFRERIPSKELSAAELAGVVATAGVATPICSRAPLGTGGRWPVATTGTPPARPSTAGSVRAAPPRARAPARRAARRRRGGDGGSGGTGSGSSPEATVASSTAQPKSLDEGSVPRVIRDGRASVHRLVSRPVEREPRRTSKVGRRGGRGEPPVGTGVAVGGGVAARATGRSDESG